MVCLYLSQTFLNYSSFWLLLLLILVNKPYHGGVDGYQPVANVLSHSEALCGEEILRCNQSIVHIHCKVCNHLNIGIF